MSRLTIGTLPGFSTSLSSSPLGQLLIAALAGAVVWTQKATLVTFASQAASVLMLSTPVPEMPNWLQSQPSLIFKRANDPFVAVKLDFLDHVASLAVAPNPSLPITTGHDTFQKSFSATTHQLYSMPNKTPHTPTPLLKTSQNFTPPAPKDPSDGITISFSPVRDIQQGLTTSALSSTLPTLNPLTASKKAEDTAANAANAGQSLPVNLTVTNPTVTMPLHAVISEISEKPINSADVGQVILKKAMEPEQLIHAIVKEKVSDLRELKNQALESSIQSLRAETSIAATLQPLFVASELPVNPAESFSPPLGLPINPLQGAADSPLVNANTPVVSSAPALLETEVRVAAPPSPETLLIKKAINAALNDPASNYGPTKAWGKAGHTYDARKFGFAFEVLGRVINLKQGYFTLLDCVCASVQICITREEYNAFKHNRFFKKAYYQLESDKQWIRYDRLKECLETFHDMGLWRKEDISTFIAAHDPSLQAIEDFEKTQKRRATAAEPAAYLRSPKTPRANPLDNNFAT